MIANSSHNPMYFRKDIFIRFEPNIDNGTLFVFNKETGAIFEGDWTAYFVLTLIDGKKRFSQLLELIAEEFNEDIKDDIFVSSVSTMLAELEANNLVYSSDKGD